MKNSSQAGNVLFYILIAIALFAALSMAVANMMRNSPTSLGAEKARVFADDIMSYSASLRNAMQTLLISNECAESQISFENGIVSGYANVGAPSNKTCHIFDSAGGGLSYQIPMEGALNKAKSGEGRYKEWYFSAVTGEGIGRNANDDLAVLLPWVSDQLCIEINTILGLGPSTTEDWTLALKVNNKFTGSYATSITIGDEAPDLEGRMAGCVTDDDGDHAFYQILIAR